MINNNNNKIISSEEEENGVIEEVKFGVKEIISLSIFNNSLLFSNRSFSCSSFISSLFKVITFESICYFILMDQFGFIILLSCSEDVIENFEKETILKEKLIESQLEENKIKFCSYSTMHSLLLNISPTYADKFNNELFSRLISIKNEENDQQIEHTD
eukprot:TRINITY_DN1389_c5_g1_i1.p1 TRINITY_DN1389_c5_g1~~TRINITY_DN1389_c5_g1_i1.p1  ORF type:complete len:158 (+),score=21.05 TRINITY_DN1389_c5_g1_i1:72-545(+)